VALAWLLVLLIAAAPAGAAPVSLAPASGEPGARARLFAAELPPNSKLEVRVGTGRVRLLDTGADGKLEAGLRMPARTRRRVRVALQDAAGKRAVLHYELRSRWSGIDSAAASDWRGRVLRLAADLQRGKLVATATVRGLAPGARVRARYEGAPVGRVVLPQTATGRALELSGQDLRLSASLPTPPAVVVATADVACQAPYETTEEGCRHAEVAALAERLAPDAILLAGDVQYQSGRLSEFRRSFDRSWGQLPIPLRPVPGNHEYRTEGAAGFFDYFALQSGWRPPPWYGYDLGPWRLLALNSNCEPDRVDCYEGSPQETWLRETLAYEPHRCTLAYWHHPRYSSGFHGSDPRTMPFWRALQDAGAELVISGHDHHYERFAPQDEYGVRDATGMRQFVVGTGGNYPSVIHGERAPQSERAQNEHFGVLVLRLYEDSYSWRFVDLRGRTLDYGNGSCL
jgi:hypothetical protein